MSKTKAEGGWNVRELDLSVVGLKYRMTNHSIRALARKCPGVKVVLERERDNKHDENAICVRLAQDVDKGESLSAGLKIGYLMRTVSSVLAPEMDEGEFEFEMGELTYCDTHDAVAELTVEGRARKKKSLQVGR